MPKNPTETKYAMGMAKGGAIWWQDGSEYVDLLKTDGPVLLIALGRQNAIRHAYLARQLFTAFYASVLGLHLDEARERMGERSIDGFWDDLASVLIQTRLKQKPENL